MRKVIAEIFGTFVLVFCGTGAIIVNEESSGAITHSGVSMVFGLVVLSMIYALGDISGAHLNPAVTISFAIAKRMKGREVPSYLVAQCVGAILASLSLKYIFPDNHQLGGTLPSGTEMQSFILEVFLTFFLMFVILSVSVGSKEKGITAGIAIASVVGVDALFAGPICGASMNPARSLAPALISGNIQSLWIYLTAPFIGGILAVFLFNSLKNKS